jgi:hypothetical protein
MRICLNLNKIKKEMKVVESLQCHCVYYSKNHMGVVMVSVLTLSAVDRRFKPRSGQTKDYKIGICFASLLSTLFC